MTQPTSQLDAWIAEERVIIDRLEQGPGPGLAPPSRSPARPGSR